MFEVCEFQYVSKKWTMLSLMLRERTEKIYLKFILEEFKFIAYTAKIIVLCQI